MLVDDDLTGGEVDLVAAHPDDFTDA